MRRDTPHTEPHVSHRGGWLRAAVLGANDGVVSTASLIVGVAAGAATKEQILLAGLAAAIAGAMSMAAGEFVSVSSQSDAAEADMEIERRALKAFPKAEQEELAAIYVERGLEPALAREVAAQLMARDALGAHVRDEIGITEIATARPLQAAGASLLSFLAGASLPLAAAVAAPAGVTGGAVAGATLVALVALGVLSARAGGARPVPAVLRIVLWGAAAMAATAAVGALFGIVV